MDTPNAIKELGYVYIQAQGRQALQLRNYIHEAERQGVQVHEGTYTFVKRGYRSTFTALNLIFKGPARVIDALGAAIDEGVNKPH